MQRRRLFYRSLWIVVLLVVLAHWLHLLRPPTRAERIQQQPLTGKIVMQIDDLYVQPSEGRRELVVRCRYLGGDPNQQHPGLQGALLASSVGPELPYGIYGQAASPFPGPGFPMLWMFSNAPEHCDQFVMRITVDSGREGEHFVDFDLPNLPVPFPR